MSKLHRESEECGLLNLELTTLPMTCTAIEQVIYNEIQSVNSISDSEVLPAEFHISPSADFYTDLNNTELYLKARVLNEDGSAFGEDELITPVNNFGHSLFQEMSVFLNDTLINTASPLYPYKAYLLNTLNYSDEAKKSWLQSAIYYADSHGDAFDQTNNKNGMPVNQGASVRYHLVKGSKVFDMIFKPCVDIFHQDRPILPNVDIRLKMTRTSPNFCLMSHDETGKKYKVQLLHACLYVRQLKINPSIAIAHQTALQRGITCKYPIARTEVTSFTIASGVMTVSKPNIINGILPHTVVIGMVGNDSFHGSYKKSPFNFKPFDISSMNLIVNGLSYPTRPLKPVFKSEGNEGEQYIRSYNTLFRGVVRQYADTGNGIPRHAYASGYTVFVVRLAEDVSPMNFGLTREGNVGLEMHFNNNTPQTLSCIVLSEYRNVMEVNKAGEITFDYQA